MNSLDAKNEVYQHYLDPDGQVTVDRDPGKWTTGNGLTHLGAFFAFITYLKINDAADTVHAHYALSACEVAKGLYDRDPGRPDLVAQDDLTGVCASAVLVEDPARADEVLTYGLKHLLFWNNTDSFTFKAFRGRFFSFMIYLLSVNGYFFSKIFRPIAWLYLKLSNPSDYHSFLNFMMVQSLAARSNMFADLAKQKAQDPKLTQAVSDYFGPDHPMTELALNLKDLT